jgi:hypothetical protein
MTRGKKGKPWESAFRRIRGVYRPQDTYPPKPTTADFDFAEKELNFRFPASYRAFAEEFGLGGELFPMVRVLPLTRPTWKNLSNWSNSSVVDATRHFHTEDWTGIDWRVIGSGDVAPLSLLRRVVVFAIDPCHHEWAFDPLEVTDRRLRECRIYDFDRTNDATVIASSFGAWLRRVDGGTGYEIDEREENYIQRDPGFPLVFKPDSAEPNAMHYVRDSFGRKATPEPQSVQRWLRWNNNTAWQLVGSIRDKGQAEAFLVLADALEEAGCQHAALLNSCRHGDPDIDGAWVLRVLSIGP